MFKMELLTTEKEFMEMMCVLFFFSCVFHESHCQNAFSVLQMLFVTHVHNGMVQVITKITENNVKI